MFRGYSIQSLPNGVLAFVFKETQSDFRGQMCAVLNIKISIKHNLQLGVGHCRIHLTVDNLGIEKKATTGVFLTSGRRKKNPDEYLFFFFFLPKPFYLV